MVSNYEKETDDVETVNIILKVDVTFRVYSVEVHQIVPLARIYRTSVLVEQTTTKHVEIGILKDMDA